MYLVFIWYLLPKERESIACWGVKIIFLCLHNIYHACCFAKQRENIEVKEDKSLHANQRLARIYILFVYTYLYIWGRHGDKWTLYPVVVTVRTVGSFNYRSAQTSTLFHSGSSHFSLALGMQKNYQNREMQRKDIRIDPIYLITIPTYKQWLMNKPKHATH